MTSAETNAYDPQQVESAAQKYWDATRAFEVDETSDKPKYYCTWATCATTPSAT